MASFQEVKIYDVKNMKSFVFRYDYCKTAGDLQSLVCNETGTPKGRQLLLGQGHCLLCMSRKSFEDLIRQNTVFLFDKESPVSNHQPQVETAEVPMETSSIEDHSRASAFFSRHLLRVMKNTKEAQKFLIDSEYYLRIFLLTRVKEILPLLRDWQKTVGEKLKRINSVKLLLPLLLCGCSELEAHDRKANEINNQLQCYEQLLKQMLEELKITKKFEGCHDNCCLERFQRSVSMVDRSHKRISNVSGDMEEDIQTYTRNHESADIKRKCRAMSQHINTHCQDKLLELIGQTKREVGSHLVKFEIIEEIVAYIEDLKKEDQPLDELLNQLIADVYCGIKQEYNVGEASQETPHCTRLPASRSDEEVLVYEREELESEVTVVTKM